MRLRAFGIAYRADLFKFYTRLDCCLILRVGTREKKKKKCWGIVGRPGVEIGEGLPNFEFGTFRKALTQIRTKEANSRSTSHI